MNAIIFIHYLGRSTLNDVKSTINIISLFTRTAVNILSFYTIFFLKI